LNVAAEISPRASAFSAARGAAFPSGLKKRTWISRDMMPIQRVSNSTVMGQACFGFA